MDEAQMKELGLDDPSKPVTAGQVMHYVAEVMLRERERLARIMAEGAGMPPQDLAAVIADDRDLDSLSWPD